MTCRLPSIDRGSRVGLVLPIVLAVLFILLLLVLILFSTGRESYNQVAVAAAGNRANLLGRSAADEARQKLAGWLSALPGRGLDRPSIPPLIEELVDRVRQRLPGDETPSPCTDSVWKLDLERFYAGANLVASSRSVARDEGFSFTGATVDLHSFRRVLTRLTDGRPLVDYHLPGSEQPEPPLVDYVGLATFRIVVRSGLAGVPVERVYSATHDLTLANLRPLARKFALFSFSPTPGADQMLRQARDRDPQARRGPVWDDLNQNDRVRSGSFRVYPDGGRAFVHGPYVIDSTGWPQGNAPSYGGSSDDGLIGPGVDTELHWDPTSFTGFGGVPAPRAGLMTPPSFTLAPLPPFDNARPAHRMALYEDLFTTFQATTGAVSLVSFDTRRMMDAVSRGRSPIDPALGNISTRPDPGVKLVKSELFKPQVQHWFAEFAPLTDKDGRNVEHRAFSLFGDPRHDRFSAYTGRLIRLADKEGEQPEDLGLIPPARDPRFSADPDVAALPCDRSMAWIKLPPREGAPGAVQPILNDIDITTSFLRKPEALLPTANSFLPVDPTGAGGAPVDPHQYGTRYDRRRLVVIPEGQLFLRVRLAKFDRPLFLKVMKYFRDLVCPLYNISSAHDLLNLLYLLGSGYPWYTIDGYTVGEQCDRLDAVPDAPQVRPGSMQGPEVVLQMDRFLRGALSSWASYLECVNGIAASPLPNEVLHLYGGHWQPLVIYDSNPDVQILAITALAGVAAILAVAAVVVVVAGIVVVAATALTLVEVMPVVIVVAGVILGGSMTFGTAAVGMGAEYVSQNMLSPSPTRPGGTSAGQVPVTNVPPGFRNLLAVAHRRYDSLEDALQPLPSDAGLPASLAGWKFLALNGVIHVKRLVNRSPFLYVGRGVVVSDDDQTPLLTGPIGPVLAGAPAAGQAEAEASFFAPTVGRDRHLTIVHFRGQSPEELHRGNLAVRLAGAQGTNFEVDDLFDPLGAAADPPRPRPTSAFFHLTLMAEQGAIPDPGDPIGDRRGEVPARTRTSNAVIKGNYVCGLVNKHLIPDDAALHVIYDPALAGLESFYVGSLSGSPVQVHQ
ncbi:MAG: hypothetical protein HY815_25900 [Candidatus Riflebacteria bacterium]|nr:hypothetical protein [Candidatus Riflebacteria bacterium]